MSDKLIKFITITILLGLITTFVIFAVYPANYSAPKKYDDNVFSSGSAVKMTKGKQKMAQKRRHNTKVSIINDDTASLGDFIFNSGGNTKIVANISLKFKNSKDGWFNGDDGKNEIIKRGVILRSAIIDTMMENHGLKTNNNRIKEKLLDNINYHLSDATATELYFNKFIVQY